MSLRPSAARCGYALALALLFASGASAQQQVIQGSGAQLRALDRLSGILTEIAAPAGETVTFANRLQIRVRECRYPAENPEGDAFALMEVRDLTTGEALFEGWMIASSPALNALDHRRYDVWVLRCNRS